LYNLRQKSSENHPIEGDVEVDETVFGGQEENTKGRKNINKKLVVLAIEKKNKGVYKKKRRKGRFSVMLIIQYVYE
jgi:hypothetical protein